MHKRGRAPIGTGNPYLPALVLLFAGSGCAALIYQVVWLQLLQLIIGSSATSLSVLLATFMGGMCLGSIALPRYVTADRHPLRVYAYLELGIGLAGLALLFGMPLVNRVYPLTGGGVAFRALVAAVCLLPPTTMMGATLPAIARWVRATPSGVAWMGFFYGGNIAGAVIGTLAAGFYLLRVFDVAVASFAAVAINVIVAIVSLRLASRTPYTAAAAVREDPAVRRTRGAGAIYLAIALSGFTALSAEVVWTRLLSLLVGATVYAFSLILAAFLLGLGIGSTAGAALAGSADTARAHRNPRVLFGWCQLLLCGALAWAAYMLTESLPYVAVPPSPDPWTALGVDMLRCLSVVLPGAILWGASFPLALAAAGLASPDASARSGAGFRGPAPRQARGALSKSKGASDELGGVQPPSPRLRRPAEARRAKAGGTPPFNNDPARLVGGVYAANTIGAIAGSLGGLIAAGNAGSRRAVQILIAVSACSAIVVLAPQIAAGILPRRSRLAAAAIAAALAASGWLAWRVAPVPGVLAAYGRNSASWAGRTNIVYVGEGLNAFVAVSRTLSGVPTYHSAGKVQASSEGEDMRLQRMLAHFSHLLPARPKDVLVIGLGAGVTAGAVAIAPGVERITVVEIERLVPSVTEHFRDYNYAVLENPKVTVTIDDARHVLLTTDRKFDVITSDLVDPWVKGTAALFTREFFEAMKAHLQPGGVVTMFVQLYLSNVETVKSEIGTFIDVFPNAIVWGNTMDGLGYDLVLTGQVEPFAIDVDALQARLDRPDHAQVSQSLREIGIASAVDLLSTYAGSAEDLAPWLTDATINRDRNLRLQYLAGLGVDVQQSGPIYAQMVQHAKFPARVFSGSPASIQAVKHRIERALERAAGAQQ